MQLTISLAQIDVALGEPWENFKKAAEWTAEALRRGSDIIVFPEMWTTGYAWDEVETAKVCIDKGATDYFVKGRTDEMIGKIQDVLND